MFKFFRKPKWTTIPASQIHAGDIVRHGLIEGEVDYVGHIRIDDHPYVDVMVNMSEHIGEKRYGQAHFLPDSPVQVIQK
jgi:UDP-3-O-[3-hydroxymyristoyl] glucosamine N-acyltransferase